MAQPAGRVHALCVAARPSCHVVYERFWEAFSEPEKAEVRGAFLQLAASVPAGAGEGHESVGRFRGGRTLMLRSGDLLFFALGSGEYSELAMAELLRGVIGAYKESFKAAALSDSAVFQNYALAALVVDEACKEGIVQHITTESILRAVSLRVYTDASDGTKLKGKSVRSIFSS